MEGQAHGGKERSRMLQTGVCNHTREALLWPGTIRGTVCMLANGAKAGSQRQSNFKSEKALHTWSGTSHMHILVHATAVRAGEGVKGATYTDQRPSGMHLGSPAAQGVATVH